MRVLELVLQEKALFCLSK